MLLMSKPQEIGVWCRNAGPEGELTKTIASTPVDGDPGQRACYTF